MKFLFISIVTLTTFWVCGCSVSGERPMQEIVLDTGWALKTAGYSQWQNTKIQANIGFFEKQLLNSQNSSLPSYRKINKTWEFKNTFSIDNGFLSFENIDLELYISGNISVFINDSLLFKGMLAGSQLELPVKKFLKQGQNKLHIIFNTPVEPENGFWEPLKLKGWERTKISRVQVNLISLNDKKAVCNVDISLESSIDTDVNIDIWINNKKPVKLRDIMLTKGTNRQTVSVIIPNPKLWWTNGMGQPNRYSLNCRLMVPEKFKQEYTHDFEIRKLNDIYASDTTTHCVNLNNQKIFIKGVEFLPPIDNFADSTYRYFNQIIRLAKEANINYIYCPKSAFFGKDYFSTLCYNSGIIYADRSQNLHLEPSKLAGSVSVNSFLPFVNKQRGNDSVAFFKNCWDSIKKYYPVQAENSEFQFYAQILHSEKIKNFIEHGRLQTENCGILYNSFNDTCFKELTNTIDSYGNCKPAYYKLKESFSNYLVIPVEKPDRVEIFIVNDDIKELNGILLCKLIDFRGNDYYVKQIPVNISASSVTNAVALLKTDLFSKINKFNACLVIQLNQPGQTVAQNMMYFSIPKLLNLPVAELKTHINVASKNYHVIMRSNVLIRNVVLGTTSGKAIFAENNFDLLPGKRYKISANYPGNQNQFEKDLVIRYINPKP